MARRRRADTIRTWRAHSSPTTSRASCRCHQLERPALPAVFVGVLLTSFGIFWGGEGAGVEWPGSDLATLGIVGFVGLVSVVLTEALRRRRESLRPAEAQA